ncbi:MAG: hypothetical protein H0U88_06490, partial [Chthoniobacterales bacterium]|nr:hypothetical protein [Chthoniobacterales bacterium]
MKGDFTRDTFHKPRHYRSVRQQQGRVQLDADWNEQMDIQTELDQSTNEDVIGQSGAPITGDGFEVGVTAGNDDLTLTAGRMYVDGILCELEADPAVTYLQQPHFPNPPALNPAAGPALLAYLDVWQRHLTAIEEPSLREVALGGPDTATRLQTIWQVKVTPQEVAGVTCKDAVLPAASDARLTNELQPSPPSTDPCELSPAGGYRGLENHFYRVEVHTGGAVGTATFKWSRENGSVTLAIEAFEKEPNPSAEFFKVRVKTLGRDDNLGLHVGDWVEVQGDETELNGEGPGTLAKILSPVEPHPDGGYTLILSVDVAKHAAEHHPKLRRWDQVKSVNADGTLDTAPDFIELEHGVRLKFSGADLHSGDYWMFAARTGTLVEPLELLADAHAHGVRHHYAPLALITFPGGTAAVHDCRPKFPALTELTSLFYLS